MNIIEVINLTQNFSGKTIYQNLNFSLKKGEVVGLLGKNGVGKSTTINILMGNLAPTSGKCLIYGKNASNLPPNIKSKIGLLYEGYVTYEYLSIKNLYEIYKSQYKKTFNKDKFFGLFDKLEVSLNQKIKTLSCGQKSQVVLGLIFACEPEILILDDYSLGLDSGYRRLFVDYLKDFIKKGDKTVLMTTHIVNDLDGILTDLIIMRKNSLPLNIKFSEFSQNFKGYSVAKDTNLNEISGIESKLCFENENQIFGFFKDAIDGKELDLSFEDKYLGYVGRY
ncbi:MAG: ABC transporter ATP-binding protein [Campylobacter sp.]|nr:ABC transporter ATP-binding protein [Campylobacter sp.]